MDLSRRDVYESLDYDPCLSLSQNFYFNLINNFLTINFIVKCISFTIRCFLSVAHSHLNDQNLLMREFHICGSYKIKLCQLDVKADMKVLQF